MNSVQSLDNFDTPNWFDVPKIAMEDKKRREEQNQIQGEIAINTSETREKFKERGVELIFVDLW